MKAIKTKYIGPGNVRGSRVVATTEDHNRIVLSWDSSKNSEENHQAAAIALCEKFGWYGTLVTGCFPDCYVHVFTESYGRPVRDTFTVEKKEDAK